MSVSSASPRRATAACLVSVALLIAALVAPPAIVAAPRVVVLGFDGADWNITREMMDRGELPHLAALAAEGSAVPLLPTNPPQTPVSWSTFATGLNPGRTEIFDFIKKKDRGYLPTLCAFDERPRRAFLFGERNGLIFGLCGAGLGAVPLLFAVAMRSRRRGLVMLGLALGVAGAAGGAGFARFLPESVPAPRNNRQGVPFWQVATDQGLSSRILQVPVTFPAEKGAQLEMLSGLGVPDIRGLNGQPTLYTSRQGARAGQFSVKVVEIPPPSSVPVDSIIEGPRNLLFPPAAGEPDPRLTIPVRFARDGEALRIEAGDRVSSLKPGDWSDWHVFEFAFNRLIKAKGMARFYNQSSGSVTEVVMSPIHLHPDAGALAGFCHPPDYSRAIKDEIGLYKTMGWASDTWTAADELATEEQALEDILFTTDGFEKMMEAELARDTDLYVQVFAFTDRIQHLFWRFRDASHPNHDPELAARHATVIEDAYRRMDAMVGKARALAPGSIFLVCSDHGFASFRRGVNLNRWLVNNGFMTLLQDPCSSNPGATRSLDDLFERPQGVFSEVDWSRTRAFAMGLGNVYVNLAGREPQGIVRPGDEYDALLTELATGLEALVDETTGERPIARVHRRDDMYRGYDPELVPDLRVANTDGYRVSWDTVLGGIPCDEVVDNMKPWSGDHCSVEPELVRGILVSSRKLTREDPDMADMAPTILEALGLAPPAALDGRSLL